MLNFKKNNAVGKEKNGNMVSTNSVKIYSKRIKNGDKEKKVKEQQTRCIAPTTYLNRHKLKRESLNQIRKIEKEILVY